MDRGTSRSALAAYPNASSNCRAAPNSFPFLWSIDLSPGNLGRTPYNISKDDFVSRLRRRRYLLQYSINTWIPFQVICSHHSLKLPRNSFRPSFPRYHYLGDYKPKSGSNIYHVFLKVVHRHANELQIIVTQDIGRRTKGL